MPLHILVISDNVSFADYLCELLGTAGHAAGFVPEGREAFRIIRQKKPDLLIVAVDSAKVPAVAVEQRLIFPEGPRTLPVIVISECPRLEAELLNVFDFLPKPLDVTRLLDSVAALAQRSCKRAPIGTLSEREYHKFSSYILSCTGLHFESRNRSSLERGVQKRMSALHIDSCTDYLAYLKRHREDRHELQKLLQFLTVGETYFFRYPSHFTAFKERLQARLAVCSEPLRIWSAGCSTGEEPYSIAISIMEALPDWRERDIKVIATDINNRSIRRAREGVYSQWSMRITENQHRKSYFDRVGESFLIKDEVKRLVEFSHLNLASPDYAATCDELRELDAIFCRNVLIYFPPEQAAGMIERFSAALKPSGQLFLGHAEALLQRSPALESRRHGNSFYYLKSASGENGAATAHLFPPDKAPLPPLGSPPREPAPPSSSGAQAARSGVGVIDAAATPCADAGSPDAREQVAARPEQEPAGPAGVFERLEAARRLFDADEFDEAYRLLDIPETDSPEYVEALILKGFILAGKGRLQEALDTCCRAIALNDLLPAAYFLKGVVLDASDRLGEAAEEYRKALLLDHDFIMPRYHMGRLHLRLGRVPEAAREIRNSIRILSKRGDEGTIPYSGGLTRSVCMMQLQNALAQVA